MATITPSMARFPLSTLAMPSVGHAESADMSIASPQMTTPLSYRQVETSKSTDIIEPHPIVGDRVIEGDGTNQEAWKSWSGLQALPRLNVKKHFSPHQRVCVFAPHPDDEVLGCGGLLQHLAANGNPILLVHVTNGTQSHPNSITYSPQKLNDIRPQESLAALAALGIAHQVTSISLELTDGNVFAEQTELYEKLAAIVRADDILVTPFMHDGHPDHEATGQVVSAFATTHRLDCYQVLIWAWHWAKPADSRIPWQHACRIDLNTEQLARKTQAIECFESQTTIDDSTGSPPVLSEQTIARVNQPWEVYLYEPTI